MDMEPSREGSEERRQKEEERMGEVYKQLERDLWSHKEPPLQMLGLRLLRYFEESWKPSPGYDEEQHNKERVAFANGLAEHIGHSDPSSVLSTSRRGQVFIRFIHNEIIIRRLYSHGVGRWQIPLGRGWQAAIQKVQEVSKLPSNYFAPLPEGREHPPPSSQLPQLEPIRYSQDTICPQSDNPQNKNGERPPSPAGNVENLEIHVHRSHGDTTSRIINVADSTPSSINPGGFGSQVVNENSALPLDNSNPARALAGGTNLQDSDIQVAASQGVAEGVLVSLSVGDKASAVPREATPPDTDPEGPMQVTEDGIKAVSLPPLEEQHEGARDQHGLEAINKSSALQSENDADTSGGAATVGTNHSDRPQEVAECLLAPLSAGDEPAVPRVVVSPGTVGAPDRPTQASRDAAQNIDSPPEGQDGRDGDKDEDQGIVGTRGSTVPNSSRDQGQRRDEGRGSNTMNDPNHLRMFRL
ncbi:hypothetical protein VNI00_014229 [Paramarasmius palmivorus]|uniref:Uncharacterized protein n=1 Tax=Paramarasmius palmivorus TaxID=297713 RepID=A0AAW0BT30_9AGAR